jgi:hypothetical protein
VRPGRRVDLGGVVRYLGGDTWRFVGKDVGYFSADVHPGYVQVSLQVGWRWPARD